MILLLHNDYRLPGGEERTVADLAWLIPRELGEPVTILRRRSASLGRGGAAAGLLAGGLAPDAVARAVRETGARVVHAHNVLPAFGWRGLAAARAAGARVVWHLHNYRLVCAVGTCFTHGEDCTRCHGRDTRPGVRLNCRGGSRAESAVYAAALAAWQERAAAQADVFAVPSAFALARLRELGAPLGDRAVVLGAVQRSFATGSAAAAGRYALFAGRLVVEKGALDAVDACKRAGVPLVVAGDGPLTGELRARARGADVTFTGHLGADALAELRRGAALALVPSRYAEILGLSALEAMAAGLPVVASATGALSDLVPRDGLHPPGDVEAMTERIRALWADPAAGERALARARSVAAPSTIAERLARIYV